MRIRCTTTLIVLAMLCLSGTSLFAQRWQNLHGDSLRVEFGRYGVEPVAAGGYVAVGTTNLPTGGSGDVLVVMTNALGAPIWMNAYDISGNGSDDVGNCIVECANGDFAITGSTMDTTPDCNNLPPGGDVFFLRITGGGAVVAAWTYGRDSFPDGGEYIRECQFGNQAFGTAPGNLIISGWSWDADGQDAYLIRITPTGILLWDGLYGGTGTDYFQGCLETQFGPTMFSGDIVAVGASDSWSAAGGPMNGFVVRCSGDNGLIVAAPENAATYSIAGGGVFTRFWTVEELAIANTGGNGVFPGDLVIVGGTNSTNPSGITDLEYYVLRTRADPCIRVVDRIHGDPGQFDDEYSTVKEIRGAPAGTPLGNRAGNIVITGHTYAMGNGTDDAILQELTTPNLFINAAGVGYKAYGNATENQMGWSVHPVITAQPTQGFVLCGYWGPFMMPGTVDPQQLYLIKTNPFGNAGGLGTTPCLWANMTSPSWTPMYPPNCVNPWTGFIRRSCGAGTVTSSLSWWMRLCFNNPKEAMSGEESVETAPYVYPNPIVQGSVLKLRFGIPEAMEMTITVSDVSGRTVLTTSHAGVKGANELELPTGDLPPGTYMVTMTAGERSTTEQFVVGGE